MTDKEPYKWVTVKGAHIPVYKDERGKDVFGKGHEDYKNTEDMVKRVVGENDSYFNVVSQVLQEEVSNRRDERNKISVQIDQLRESIKAETIRDKEVDEMLGRNIGDAFVKYTDKGKELKSQIDILKNRKSKLEDEISYHESRLQSYNREQRNNQQNEWLSRIGTKSTMREATKQSYQGFKLDESTTPRVDDALKAGHAKVMEMSPMEYIERANYQIFNKYTVAQNIAGRSVNPVNRYAEMMRQGVKFDTPYLDYENIGQEGIHRALAAIQNGYERIPVIVVSKRHH